MIDQIFLIRKMAPDHVRAQIKLANPQLMDLLVQVYWQFHDHLLRDLIQQLMSMAGPDWISLLQEENPSLQTDPPSHSRVYRGHNIQASATPPATNKLSADIAPKSPNLISEKEKTRIYRGRPM